MIIKLTNISDLTKCMTKLKSLRELTPNEEITIQIDMLTIQEHFLKRFPSRDWLTILRDLESGKIKDYLYSPGSHDWLIILKEIKT